MKVAAVFQAHAVSVLWVKEADARLHWTPGQERGGFFRVDSPQLFHNPFLEFAFI